MKKILLFLIAVLAAVSVSSCKDERFRDHALLRRLRLRNTAEAVSQDFAEAFRTGDTSRLLALSDPAVRCKLENELRLVFPHLSDAERMQAYALSLKLSGAGRPLQAIPVRHENTDEKEEEEEKKEVRFYRIAAPDSVDGGHFIELRRDRYGNWKNVSRL